MFRFFKFRKKTFKSVINKKKVGKDITVAMVQTLKSLIATISIALEQMKKAVFY